MEILLALLFALGVSVVSIIVVDAVLLLAVGRVRESLLAYLLGVRDDKNSNR
jgi:hypothetical protein